MTDNDSAELSVPNSNPTSAFSRFEIRNEAELKFAYVLFGIKEDEAVFISAFGDLKHAKDFLVDLNGPLPENLEDEE
jgi:hypothetical protein